jgi:hypothetical protein
MTVFKIGDHVRYSGPILLGSRWQGEIARLPLPHKPGLPRKAIDDRIMVKVASDQKPGRPVKLRPVRHHHLEKI